MRTLEPDVAINFAHEPTFLDFLRNPNELEERLAPYAKPMTVFIDEVQRLPSVLNTVQALLELKRNVFAIEVKASTIVGSGDLRGLRSFADFYGRRHRAMLFCQTKIRKVMDGVEVWPWQEGIREIFEGG